MRTIINHTPATTMDPHAVYAKYGCADTPTGDLRRWKVLAITATVTSVILALLLALSLAGGLGRTHTPAQPDPVIPRCDGCGYTVTTFFPDHTFRTVNYFSEGGQQVAEQGEWVK